MSENTVEVEPVKWKPLLAVLLGMLIIGMNAKSVRADDIFSVTFKNKNGRVVYSGQVDYFYCSWEFLSGQPYDAWGIRMYYVPGKYLTILNHWGRGSLQAPQTYKWFIKEEIRAGDRSPYDHYLNLPAPWLKVRYRYIGGLNKATYNCALDLFIEAIPVFNIPVYVKRKTIVSSFRVLIIGPPSSSSALPHSEVSIDEYSVSRELQPDYTVTYILFPMPDMRQVRETIAKILSKERFHPDFIVIETRKFNNTQIITITGYKEAKNKREAQVIFSQSITQKK